MLVSDGIIVPNPCYIWSVSFENEFSHMDIVGPLIRCLYFKYATVVGSMTTLD